MKNHLHYMMKQQLGENKKCKAPKVGYKPKL